MKAAKIVVTVVVAYLGVVVAFESLIGYFQPADESTLTITTVDRDGAPVGRHSVTVHCRRPPTDQERKNLVVTELLIPARYAQHAETPLVFEVTKGGNREYDIALE